ncbi:type VI secretion system tip protein TssI/VgrG [Orrella sp. JC864]|uniref:type VI secretion system Vgr family protein n=1 Tax=Orrella sp. JC864 TaxID=3120298 RepID=UPI00300BAD16
MNRIFTVHTALPDGMLEFRAMSGTEALSSLFEFEVEMQAESYALDLRQMLGKPLTLAIALDPIGKRYLNGQVTRCTLVGRAGPTARHYIYRATVRPWLWYLTQTTDSKIFQNKPVPEVIQEVLGEYGFAVESQLTASYRNWEYCVQYQESDFNFVSRLMEHEGIYYWFRHEEGKHTLILSDSVTRHETLPHNPMLTYYGPDRVAQPGQEYVSSWEPAEQITPGRFATVDYDFKKPAASLEALRSNPGGYEHGDLEVYEWMGGYTEPDQGEQYSRIRLEALQARQSTVEGMSNVKALAPGYLFTLRNHPRQGENREYLVHRVSYNLQENGYATGDALQSLFELGFSVLPSSTPYRAPRLTPIPRTHGPQTATVVGKPGEQLWTDSYGRVKVQFHWDRYGQKNESSSCWVRVSSPWAGGGFGGIQLPRVGDEVIVDFIGGQPDRPIIIGRVYNGSNMPPWDLPGNATQSGFLSRSKDGTPGTANALMFEDKAGQELIVLHAERDLTTEVEANEMHTVDGNRNTVIGGADTLTVMGTRTTTVHAQETETFLAGADRTVTGDVNETVQGNETRTFTGNIIETITGDVDETITGNLTQATTGEVNRTITGDVIDTTTGNVDESITGNLTQETTGDVTRTITGNVTDTITGDIDLTITGNTVSTQTGTISQTVSGQFDIFAETGMTVTTPAWKVVNTGETQHWLTSYIKFTPDRKQAVGMSLDFWGLREQFYAVNMQAAALKLDFAAAKNSSSGLEVSSTVTKMATTAAAEIRNGAITVTNKVMNLFT